MDPVLSGEVVEREQHDELVGDLGGSLGPRRAASATEVNRTQEPLPGAALPCAVDHGVSHLALHALTFGGQSRARWELRCTVASQRHAVRADSPDPDERPTRPYRSTLQTRAARLVRGSSTGCCRPSSHRTQVQHQDDARRPPAPCRSLAVRWAPAEVTSNLLHLWH